MSITRHWERGRNDADLVEHLIGSVPREVTCRVSMAVLVQKKGGWRWLMALGAV
jgi:hypothetical protein